MSDEGVLRLCERWRMKRPEAAITCAVYSAFPELKTVKPPVDVFSLASKRRIASIQRTIMQADGMISIREDGAYDVKLNKSHSGNRQRFTCAHEIGHTFFFEVDQARIAFRAAPKVIDGDLRGLVVSDQEEMLCNMAAAEILLPQDSFVSAASRLKLSAQTVVNLSKVFRASLWSVSKRLVQFGEHNLVIAAWNYEANLELYRTQWIVQTNRRPVSQLTVTQRDPFFGALSQEEGFRGRKWISLGGPIDDYFVDAIVLRSSNPRRVLTLFVLERNPERLLGNASSSLIGRQVRLF